MIAADAVPAFAASAPVGFQVMCIKSPGECRAGGESIIETDTTLLTRLQSVNVAVNRSIKPRRDSGTDVWSVGVTTGDCEDYVLTKRRSLIRAGLPPSALRIASVRARNGAGHAILVVKTTTGDFALDNLHNKVRPLSQTGYRILAMSSADPRVWN
jgi:predicted transglutaminase-like cysteine proteinase